MINKIFALLLILSTTGCGWVDSTGSQGNVDPVDPVVPVDPVDPVAGVFTFPQNLKLVEGTTLSFSLNTTIKNVAVTARTENDYANITMSATSTKNGVTIALSLGYSSHPILPHDRTFTLDGTFDGVPVFSNFDVAIIPTTRPDVYILAGQSNMVGYAGDTINEAEVVNERLLQLNVTPNDEKNFQTSQDHTSVENNILSPTIIVARDPLHNRVSTADNSIGLGMTFGRDALENTTADVVLVPTAMSSSAFCEETGPSGQWNPVSNKSNVLGNTWLFDRAVLRANEAMVASGGILRGILWHQGESDGNRTACALLYEENIVAMVAQFRKKIIADASGSHDDVPFVVGTMSRGGSYAIFDDAKLIVDAVHKNIALYVPLSGVENNDDLVPLNGYPCSTGGDCIHFGADALREIGHRYYQVLNQLTQ